MAPTLSKNSRVLALIASLAVGSFVVGGLVSVVTAGDATRLDVETARLAELGILASDLAATIDHQEVALADFVVSRDEQARIRFGTAMSDEAGVADAARTLAVGLPGVMSAVDGTQLASAAWRRRIADPAILAVRTQDAVGLETYARQAAADDTTTEVAISQLGRELVRGQAALALQKASVDTTAIIGIIIAFGFMSFAFVVAIFAVWRFGRALERDARHAGVLNRFTELTTFAIDDREVAAANLVALSRLTAPDAAVTHILNRSLDRAVPEAMSGDPIAEILPLGGLGRCAGVLRGTMYVTDDLSDDLAVHCPIYPAAIGTLACIPLVSGEAVGAVHLYWLRPNGLPLTQRAGVARITEHAALAIGNRRLLAALHGQANTDARTGLANSRSFDLALEKALAGRMGHEPLSVMMVDVDHFKLFNDRHGHPAGDEALRAFGSILRSSMRDGDVASRYGGEEFAIYLPGIDPVAAFAIAERIRTRTEATIIPLAPGLTDRITISIGIASAPDQGDDRVTLLRVADEALYRAKEGGRNRVVSATPLDPIDPGTPGSAGPPAPRPLRHRRAAPTAVAS